MANPNHGGSLIDFRGVGPTLAKNRGNWLESVTAGCTRSAKNLLALSFRTNVSTARNWRPKNSTTSPIKNQLFRLSSMTIFTCNKSISGIEPMGRSTSNHSPDNALCG